MGYKQVKNQNSDTRQGVTRSISLKKGGCFNKKTHQTKHEVSNTKLMKNITKTTSAPHQSCDHPSPPKGSLPSIKP
jgi:hypothetical protein